MSLEPPNEQTVNTLTKYRWPLVVLSIGLMGLIAFLASIWLAKSAYDQTLDRSGRAGQYVADKAENIARQFMKGSITTSFLAALPQISSVGSGNLELAKAEQTELFRAEDDKTIFWDTLPLGKTISEIRVPVTYRYHLRLADPWHLDVSGQTCIVIAPRIHASLPPAIHTHKMEKKSEAGWARFNAREQMDELQRSITPTLSRYAASPRYIDLAREECRKTVAEFVKTWLLKEDHWRTDRFRAIKVIFADETNAVPSRLEPTIQLQDGVGPE